MHSITVRKEDLMETIHKNRDRHRTIFEDALVGFQKEAMRILEDQMDRASRGLKQNLYVSLQCPQDHTPDYDRVLGMMVMEVSDTIQLSEQDYSQYVLDNWAWKQQWAASNQSYSALVATTPGYQEYTGEDWE